MNFSNNKASFWVSLFSCIFIVIFEYIINAKWHCACVLTYDIFGYYSYLPAFFYGDLKTLSNLPALISQYQIAGEMSNFHLLENGNYLIKYTSGMAWLYLPFFGIAHLWAKLGGYAVDGFSQPYQAAIIWGCTLYSLAGLFIIRKLLLRYFEDKYVAISIIAIAIGTHYINYASFDSPMSHGPLFALFAFTLLQIDNWHKQATIAKSLLLGFLCGFSMMTRPTEVFVLIVFFFWKMETLSLANLIQRFRFFLVDNHKNLIFFTLTFFIGLLPQLVYWYVCSGSIINYSYGDQGFDFSGKFILNCFFSYQKGWLTYTPMMLFSLIGIVIVFKKYPLFRWAILIFFVINTYILFSWHNWWYGGGFGQRAMIDSYPLLMFPMTALWTEIHTKKIKYLVYPLALCFLVLNLFQLWQAQTGKFETEFMSKAYYWRIFGKTQIDEKIDKKLLDTQEELPHELENHLQKIYFNDFEAETNNTDSLAKAPFSGKKAILIDKAHSKEIRFQPQTKLTSGWLRAKVKWLSPAREWGIWQSPMMYILLKNGNDILKQNAIRIHRYKVIECNGNWEDVWIDIKIPSDSEINTVAIIFSADTQIQSFVDDVEVDWSSSQ